MDLFVNVVNTHKNYTQKLIDKNVHSDFIFIIRVQCINVKQIKKIFMLILQLLIKNGIHSWFKERQ